MIEGDVLHHVEAVGDGHGVVGLAEVPLAGEEGRVAGLLEDGGERPFLLGQAAPLAGERDGRHAAPVGDAAGDQGGPARGAARLAVERPELHALAGHPVEVRGGHAAALAAAVGAEVPPAGVIGDEEDDVRLLRRLGVLVAAAPGQRLGPKEGSKPPATARQPSKVPSPRTDVGRG